MDAVWDIKCLTSIMTSTTLILAASELVVNCIVQRGRGLSVRRCRGKRELHVNRRDSNFVRPHTV
jgi:hypothetical protein